MGLLLHKERVMLHNCIYFKKWCAGKARISGECVYLMRPRQPMRGESTAFPAGVELARLPVDERLGLGELFKCAHILIGHTAGNFAENLWQ